MPSYLWQNFLLDTEIVEFIVDKIEGYKFEFNIDQAIEVWPWRWVMTEYLANMFDDLVLFEKDIIFQKNLEKLLNTKKQKIVWGDVLDQKIDDYITTDYIAIWNIPYYITSPILKKIFLNWKKRPKIWIIMLQKAVWEKIRFDGKKKSYLRWLINYKYDVHYLKTVSSKAFSPAPKVDSCIVEIRQKEKEVQIDFDKLLKLLDVISPYKRKTLWKIWKIIWKNNETNKKQNTFYLPENLSNKRIEELDRNNIKNILENSK